MANDKKDLVVKTKNEVSEELLTHRRGFEDEQDGDLILPRAKVLQITSLELTDERYEDQNLKAGMMINSLTKELLPEIFIPIFKFNSKVLWVPKSIGGGMACRSLDGKTGTVTDAVKWGPYDVVEKKFNVARPVENGQCINCEGCPYSAWKDGIPPVCMPSMNFFSIFDGQAFPLVLSFKSTSMKFGKKLYSMAKMMPGDMFDYKYRVKAYRKSNEKGTYYETDIFPAGKSTSEEYNLAEQMYNSFKNLAVKFDETEEDTAANNAANFENSVTEDM